MSAPQDADRLDSIADAVAAIRAGELVVVVDDTDRENEGDLIMAAAPATAERMAFMIRHTSGIICAPMGSERAERLHLPPMVANNLDPLRTAFTVSVDYRVGLTTGISAEERANTVRALARDEAQPREFLRPGHVFPLIARAGGVLTRSGHTEAAIDLAEMAGLPDVAVLAEVVNDDGTVKRLADLLRFARDHGLRIISIEDLIADRLKNKKLIHRLHHEKRIIDGMEATLHVYGVDGDEPSQHVAVTFGAIGDGRNVPCRIQQEDVIANMLGSGREGWDIALRRFRAQGRGLFVLLRRPGVLTPSSGQERLDGAGEHHESAQARKKRWLDIGVGAQILRDLGISSINLIAAQDKAYVGLSGYGIDIVGRYWPD